MQKLIFTLLVAAAAVGAFWQTKDAGFVWNDRQVIFGEPERETTPRQQIANAWTWHRSELYTPVAGTAWAAIRASGRGDEGSPKAFHVASMATHALAAALVFLILALCLESQGAAFLGALLFALHPLQVETVAYVGAFPFLLGTCFALLAIWEYLRYARARENTMPMRGRTNPVRHYYVATAAFALALLTNPATAVAPLMAAVVERLMPRRSAYMASRTPAWPLTLWVVLAVPVAVLAAMSQNTAALASQLPLWSKPVVAADALSFYASKLFAPLFIAPDYGRSPSFLVSNWWGFVTWIFPVCLLLALGYWRGKARTWYLAACALLAIGLAPFLGLVHFEAQATSTVANRFVYLAMLGPALALAYTVSNPKRSWLPLIAVVALAACGWGTRQELQHWQSDEALWSHAVRINPGSPIAHETLGHNFRAQKNWEQARVHYNKVLEVNPASAEINFYLGEIERLHGTPAKAVELFERTLKLDPEYAPAHSSLGLAKLATEDFEGALANFRKAVELNPDDHAPLQHLGMLYVRKKAYADAVPFLTRALDFGKDAPAAQQATTHALLGLALAGSGQGDRAQGHLEKALALDAGHVEANRTLADIYFAQGKYAEARPRYERVVAAADAAPEAYNNLGIILAMNKEHDKAVAQFTKALDLKADFADAHNNIGVSLFHLRRFKESTEHLDRALELKPDLADPYYYKGDIARWQGRHPEAIAFYYRALKINPGHVDANYRLGNHFMKESKVPQAIRHYQAALRVAPEDPKLIYGLKKAEKELGGGGSASSSAGDDTTM